MGLLDKASPMVTKALVALLIASMMGVFVAMCVSPVHMGRPCGPNPYQHPLLHQLPSTRNVAMCIYSIHRHPLPASIRLKRASRKHDLTAGASSLPATAPTAMSGHQEHACTRTKLLRHTPSTNTTHSAYQPTPPLPCPHRCVTAPAGAVMGGDLTALVAGDQAWMLVSSALVLLMTPGELSAATASRVMCRPATYHRPEHARGRQLEGKTPAWPPLGPLQALPIRPGVSSRLPHSAFEGPLYTVHCTDRVRGGPSSLYHALVPSSCKQPLAIPASLVPHPHTTGCRPKLVIAHLWSLPIHLPLPCFCMPCVLRISPQQVWPSSMAAWVSTRMSWQPSSRPSSQWPSSPLFGALLGGSQIITHSKSVHCAG